MINDHFSERMGGNKRKKDVFKFEESDMENIKELLNNDGKMIETANELFNYRQADNTAAGYVTTINKFREFCTERKGLNFDKFGEKELAGFIVHMARVMPNSKYMFGSIKPAISRLEVVRGIKPEESAFTPTVIHLLQGAKRRAIEKGPEARKMDILPKEALEKALREYIWPYLKRPMDIDLHIFRIVFRWVIYTKTMCRWDCLSQLQAKHFEVTEVENENGEKVRAIAVRFPKSKNNQVKNVDIRMLDSQPGSILDTVTIVALYFKRCGFRMDGLDQNYISCRITSKGAGQRPIPGTRLSYSTCMAQAKEFLELLGFPTENYGETSAKRAAVTYAIEGGTPVDVVQQVGAWKTAWMPLVYANNSIQHKTGLVKRMKY